MTVRDAIRETLERLGLHQRHISRFDMWDVLGEELASKVWRLFTWLHRLSAECMEQRYGMHFGWHRELPPDIDAATPMNEAQQAEFHRQLEQVLREVGECG